MAPLRPLDAPGRPLVRLSEENTLETLILAQSDGGSGAGGILGFVLIIALLGGFFWFMILRPQRAQMRNRRSLVASLEVGDEIRTGGGIFGTIRRLDEESAIIEVEDGGLLRVVRLAIIARVEPQG